MVIVKICLVFCLPLVLVPCVSILILFLSQLNSFLIILHTSVPRLPVPSVLGSPGSTPAPQSPGCTSAPAPESSLPVPQSSAPDPDISCPAPQSVMSPPVSKVPGPKSVVQSPSSMRVAKSPPSTSVPAPEFPGSTPVPVLESPGSTSVPESSMVLAWQAPGRPPENLLHLCWALASSRSPALPQPFPRPSF